MTDTRPSPDPTPDSHPALDGTLPGRTPEAQPIAPALRLLAGALKRRMFQRAPAPVRFGRYTLLEPIGEGGMGVVFAAYDDALDRKVAIKIQRGGHHDGHTQARLIREAKALGQLSHPNVVQVFDVGEVDGQVFLAMEFVRGRTLAAWRAAERRPWPAVLDVLLQAGRGLAAAHAAGVVHRDFKPENVLVGDDGRARVADFGLARADPGAGGGADVPPPRSTSLTATGLMVGTPAYMSPEQFRGARTVDARSDQFSFCAVAWECLFDERPFAGDDLATLRDAVLAGRVRAPHDVAGVPGRVLRALQRGLQVDPDARFPAMEALLAALAPAGRGRALGALLVGAAGVTAGLIFALTRAPGEDPVAQCRASAGARVGAVWSDEARASVRAGLSAVGAPFARDVAGTVEAAVDRHAADLERTYADSCQATAAGEQSSALLDLRAACLNGQLRELDALLRVFGRADVAGAARALAAVEALPSPARCGPELVGAGDPPARPDEVDAVRARLAEAAAELRAGDYQDGLGQARAAADAAAALDYPPLTAEALLLRGELEARTSAFVESGQTLAAAMLAARRARAPELAGRIAFARAEVEHGRRDWEAAEPWLELAAADLGPRTPDPALRIALRGLHAQIGWSRKQTRDAADDLARTVTEAEQILGPDHTLTIRLLRDLGKLRWSVTDYARSEESLAQALERSERTFGREHPDTAVALLDFSKLEWVRGDYVRALGVQLQALTLLQVAHGADHASVGYALVDIGASLGMMADDMGAEAHFLAALEVLERTLGPGSPIVASCLDNLAQAVYKHGDLDEALRLTRRAAAVRLAAFGPMHPEAARSHLALGEALSRIGEHEAAAGEYEQALALRRNVTTHVVLFARARFALAQSLTALGRDRERAAALARAALTDFERHGPGAVEAADNTRELLRKLDGRAQ